MRTRELTAAVLICLSTAGSVGCHRESPSAPTPQIPVVEVITVTPKTVMDEPEFIGQTEASRPVEIRSQVTGIIKNVFFHEGRDLKRGDRLYLIDPVPFEAAVLSAKAQIAQAQARLVQARQDFARVKPLLKQQAVSQKDVDDAVASELEAKAALEAAKAEFVKAKFDMDNTIIVAPIAGRIERSRFYEGRLVSAQTDLLTTIHQLDPMYVNVNVPESYILRRRRELAEHRVERPGLFHLRGVITFVDGSTYPHEGVLDFAGVGLRSETGSLQGRFVFPNPAVLHSPKDQSPFPALFPGQFVKVRVRGYVRTDAILVPQRAVQQGTKGSFAFVVGADDKVEARQVQATAWHEGRWLIESGLHEGERVVVGGLHLVRPGTQVKPVPFDEARTPADGRSPNATPESGQ